MKRKFMKAKNKQQLLTKSLSNNKQGTDYRTIKLIITKGELLIPTHAALVQMAS